MDAKDFQDVVDKAAAQAKADGVPVLVYLPAGVYKLDRPLMIPKNVDLVISGKLSDD
jgi:hypothetical protein